MDHGTNGVVFSDRGQERKPPPRYCLKCQAELPWADLPDEECYQCGLQFDNANPETYRERRDILLWKFWLPGFLLAMVSGTISYVICMQTGDWGVGLFIAVPLSVGAILGYGTSVRLWLLGGLGIVCTGGMILALVSMNVAGFFCGMTLALILIAPVGFGLLLGWGLRLILLQTAWDQRWFFPLLLMMLFPHGVQWLEHQLPRRTEYRTVQTELSVHATPQEAWEAIMFYEDVEHSPPWLLQLALPKPIRSEGRKDREGEIVRCFYDRGYLVKRISKVEPGRKLVFDVTQQHLHFERDVTLRDGSFEIIPVDGGYSRIKLTTRYERHLRPTWMWQSIETQVIHTLHGHVLEGMKHRAEETQRNRNSEDRTTPHPTLARR